VTNEIQQNRYDRLVRRVAGIIGPGSKVSEVLTELFPMIDVENMPSELLILSGTNMAWGGGTITGAAGESPKMGVFNPDGSNTIITMTGFIIASASAPQTIRWGFNTNQLANAVSTQTFGDTRNTVGQLPVGQVGSESAVAMANATGQTRILSNTPHVFNMPNDLGVLRPGIGFEVGSATRTSVLQVTFYWRERPMESSETLASG